MCSKMRYCYYCGFVTEHKNEVCWVCVYRGMAMEQIRMAQGAEDEEEDRCPCKECKQQREEK